MNNYKLDFEHFFDLSPDLICIAGFDGYFKKVNNAVARLLGFSKEELYVKPINEFIHPDDRAKTINARKELVKLTPLYNFENRYINKNGESIWLSWTSVPVESERVIFAIAKDISFKKLLENERQELFNTLIDENIRLRKISLTTSHDLRSPVNNLISIFDMVDLSRVKDEETLDKLELFKISTEELKENMDSYLDKLNDAIDSKPKTETLRLDQALEEVMHSIKSLICSTKTKIESDFTVFSEIHFNKENIKSVFLNLITNAIKYSRANIYPEVSISTRVLEGKKQMLFKDNGQGFDLNLAAHKIFKLKQTFHNNPDSKGVGLYLVKKHITDQGGRIEVESEIGKGTCFTITFED